MTRPIEITVTGHSTAEPQDAFDVIVPLDLASIFEPWLFLPGVQGVRDQSGPWDEAGQSRIVQLSDGSEVPERLTAVDRPRGFAYRVGPFPRPLGVLASAADGAWKFSPGPNGGTDIAWSYRFDANPGRRTLMRLMLSPLWRRYAGRVLSRAIRAADAAAGAPSSHAAAEPRLHGR